MTQDDSIGRLLSEAKTIAIIGCSPKPERDSNRVAGYLKEAGYQILPVNPVADEILGLPVFPSLAAIPAEVEIDIVDVFRRPEHIPAVLEAVLERGAKALWLQLGCGHPESEARARTAGLQVVSDLCIKIEHRSRFGDG